MIQTKYSCDCCGVEVKTYLGGKNNDKDVLLDLWEVNITKVSPENQSLSQHFRGDADEGKSGQVCKACLLEWYPTMKCKQQSPNEVKHE